MRRRRQHATEKVIQPRILIRALPIVDGGANDAKILNAGDGQLKVAYSGLNSLLSCCEVNGSIQMSIQSDGTYVAYGGEDYPDFEVIQYRPGQPRRSLGRDRAGFAGGNNAMPVAMPRIHEWVDGRCTIGFSCSS